jgi:DNA-binding MurR/RpiR family transcriptional regulator
MREEFDKQILDTLTSNESKVLEYINANLSAVTKMNLKTLSENTFVSPATIMRLCKKLDLSGFSELKYIIKHSAKEHKYSPDTSFGLPDVLDKRLIELRETAQSIDAEALKFVTDCLCSDKNIHLFARGITFMPMNYMYNMLLSLGRSCIEYIDIPLIYRATSEMTDNDVLFIASAGGATEPIQKVAAMAREHHATVIAITSTKESPLEGYANITFYGYSPNRFCNGVDIIPRFPIMFILNAIVESYINRIHLNQPSDPSVYINLKNW